jgi:hypothetical protein
MARKIGGGHKMVGMSLMLKEIRQQPQVLERTLRSELRKIERLQKLIEQRRPRLIVLAARGTSDNAALFGRYLLEITTGIPVSLAAPSIHTLYGAKLDYREALVVGISQSGESTDTNLVVERARTQGALTIGVTNEPGSSLAGLAEHVLHVRAGREKSVAATKTYTGQLLLMYLLASELQAQAHRDDQARRLLGPGHAPEVRVADGRDDAAEIRPVEDVEGVGAEHQIDRAVSPDGELEALLERNVLLEDRRLAELPQVGGNRAEFELAGLHESVGPEPAERRIVRIERGAIDIQPDRIRPAVGLLEAAEEHAVPMVFGAEI